MARRTVLKVEHDVVLIERSNIDRVTLIDKDGVSWTALEEIQKAVTERGWWSGRKDIALVNVIENDEHTRQLAVYPSWAGPTGDGWDLLNDKEKAWCRAENDKLVALVKKHPEVEVYLGTRPVVSPRYSGDDSVAEAR